MSVIDRLERRCGWLAFPGFLRFYAILHALVYVLQIFRPDIRLLMDFDRARILSGEVWRMVTFLFCSTSLGGVGPFGIMIMFFMVVIAFMMSDALEGAWGAFRTTLFYYVGILGLIGANFLIPNAMEGSGILLYMTSFLAFATLFPQIEFLILFILPVQVRVLAWIQVGLMALGILGDFRMLPFFLLAHLHYVLWAGIPAMRGRAKVVQSAQRRKAYTASQEPDGAAFHACAVCERTDVSDPELEFRVCSDGEEYCAEHLPQ